VNLLFLVPAIIVVWAACSAILMGIGSLVLRSFSQESHPIDSFCFGIGVTVGILEIYQCFRPIDFLISAILFLAGAIGFAADRLLPVRILSKIQSSSFEVRAGYAAILGLTAFRSSGPCEHFDTGLYGAPAVRWLVTYPIVPGLANLHGRLGFNSCFFLFVAALHHGIFINLSYRIMEGLLIAMVAPFVIEACLHLLKGETNSAGDWFLAILFVPLVFNAARSDIVGTNTDLAAMLICLLAAYFLFSALDGGIAPQAKESLERRRLLTAMLLFAVAISFKLSMLVFASLGWAIALIKLQWFTARDEKRKLAVLACLVISAGVLIPWVLRSFILSGYPFYPNSSFGIPVEWRVPKTSVNLIAAGVRAWARAPHASLQETMGYLWVKPWLHGTVRSREGFGVPAVFAGIGSLLLGVKSLRSRNHFAGRGLLLLLPSSAGLVFWFFQAPALRFGEAVIWVTAATLSGYGLASALHETSLLWRRLVLALVILTSGWCLYPRTLWNVSFLPAVSARSYDPLPPWDADARKTHSGLTVYIPKKDGQCWDAPMPCAAYFNETLRLRDPDNMSRGFVSDGFPADAEWLYRVR
jgi:hypothetical protein